MKKRIIITGIMLRCVLFAGAQHSLQSELNMFRANDVLIKQQVEYKDPGRRGAQVLWDFSQLNVIHEEYKMKYSTLNDTVITGTEHLTHYHYVLQNDSLLLWGFDNQTTKLHDVQPELLLRFPVNYGDTVESYHYGHGKYGNRLELDAFGTIRTEADSYGMMILPNKDTLRHVLRTHTVKSIAKDTRPIGDAYYEKMENPLQISPDSIDFRLRNDSVLFFVETFRWYECGYRYPIFETVKSWEAHNRSRKKHEFLATAFFYPPQAQYYVEDTANQTLRDSLELADVDPWAGLTYNIYPNPVKTGLLYVEMYLPKRTGTLHAQLRSSATGMLVLAKNLGFRSEGICNFQMDMRYVPAGNYIFDIWLDEKLISEIILKR